MFRLLLVFGCVVSTSYACSCLLAHPQQGYCKADYVLRAKIIRRPTKEDVPNPHGFGPNTMQVYQLYIIAIFRGYSVIQQSESWNSDQGIVKLYTPSTFHSCSVKLQTDKEYVIGGSFRNKRLHANLCNLIQEWEEMTPDEKTRLLFQYLPNCACAVDVCFGKKQAGHTCKTTEKMACSFNFNEPSYARRCRRKHQYCRFNATTESCAWHKTRKYKTCIEDIP